MPKHNAIAYPVEQIRQWIEGGKTQAWIAETLQKTDPRISAKLIYKVCKKHGIQCQRTGPRSAQGHPEWRGGRIVGKNGYIRVYCPDHPSLVPKNQRRMEKANGGYYRKNVYVWEHRLVMEEKLGRFLLPNEVVHHIDGNVQNNHPSNLELFQSNGEHLKETLVGQIPKWTAAGKAAIDARNSPENRRARDFLKASIRRESGASEPLNNSELRRYLKRLGKSLIEAYEMASRQ